CRRSSRSAAGPTSTSRRQSTLTRPTSGRLRGEAAMASRPSRPCEATLEPRVVRFAELLEEQGPASPAFDGFLRANRLGANPKQRVPRRKPFEPQDTGVASGGNRFVDLEWCEPGERVDLVRGVEGSDLVGGRERRVVEDRVDEVVDGSVVEEDALAEVDELGGARAEHVRREEPAVVGRDQQLEQAVRVAEDLAPRKLAVARDPDLVRRACGGQSLLGGADEADFRNRVDPEWQELRRLPGRLPAGCARCQTPLLHGGGGKAREADHVADCPDVLDSRPEVRPDADAAPLVGSEPGRLEPQIVSCSLPAGRVEDGLGHDPFAALEEGDRAALEPVDADDGLAEAK